MIAISATGFDKIDIQACQDHGVIVHITDYAQQTVPEHTFALILFYGLITAYCKDKAALAARAILPIIPFLIYMAAPWAYWHWFNWQ